ncbi:MAG: lysophospholipid acyltransferase family protein [Bacteroidota bacterium]
MNFKKIAPPLINLLSKTWRISIQGELPNAPCVVAFWHGEMLPVWKVFKKQKAVGVTSLSKDGDMLAALLKTWDFRLIRGSSSRGGDEVLKEMAAAAKSSLVLITPDGPRGPRLEMKAGAVIAAQRANVPLVLCGVKIHSKKVLLKSWDLFQIPLPFSKIELRFSEKILIRKDASREEITGLLKDCELKLNRSST